MKDTTKKNKIETHWSLLCRTASVDQQSNQISIFNVLEELQVSKIALDDIAKSKDGKVILPLDFNLVVQNERIINDTTDVVTPTLRIKVIDPSGKELLTTDTPLAFKSTEKRMRSIFSFPHMILTGAGTYAFISYVRLNKNEDFKLASTAKLEVMFK